MNRPSTYANPPILGVFAGSCNGRQSGCPPSDAPATRCSTWCWPEVRCSSSAMSSVTGYGSRFFGNDNAHKFAPVAVGVSMSLASRKNAPITFWVAWKANRA